MESGQHDFALYNSLGHLPSFTGFLVHAFSKHFHALCLL